jgi:hypothetical protein
LAISRVLFSMPFFKKDCISPRGIIYIYSV